MTMIRYICLLVCLFVLAAWDTKEYPYKDADEKNKWQSIYLCLEGQHFFCARNEHEQISNDALALASPGNPWLIGGRTDFFAYDLNSGYFRPDLRGKGDIKYIESETTNSLERRLLPPVPHYAGLPDFSYTIYDWANKNALCPALPRDHPDKAECHVFEGWHAARLNASHFGTQAAKSYKRLHAVALMHAGRARQMREATIKAGEASLKYHGDAIREAEYLALAYEAAGQHFLSDRWALGHMFDRWGAPEYIEGVYDDPRGAKLAGVITGMLHGYESVATEKGFPIPDALSSPEVESGELVIPQWRFPADGRQDAPVTTYPGVGDYRYEDMGDGAFGAEYRFLDSVRVAQGGVPVVQSRDFPLNVTHQQTWLMACLSAGYGEVIQAFGTHPSGGFGIDGMALSDAGRQEQPEACFTPRATNAAIAMGWELDGGAVQGGFRTAQIANVVRLIVLPASHLVEDGDGIDMAMEAAIGEKFSPAERASLVRFTAKVHRRAIEAPLGTDIAAGGFGRFGSMTTGDKYPVASYLEPEDLADLPERDPRGRDKESLFGVYNRAGADFMCTRSHEILNELRVSATETDQQMCQVLAQRLYVSTWEDYAGQQQEHHSADYDRDQTQVAPLCSIAKPDLSYARSEDMPKFLHPGYVSWSDAADPSVAARPFVESANKLSNQSIANWCASVPVITPETPAQAAEADRVARVESEDDEVVLSGHNFGEEQGHLYLGQHKQNAIEVADILDWSDTRIRFKLGEQFADAPFTESAGDAATNPQAFLFVDALNEQEEGSSLRSSVGRFLIEKSPASPRLTGLELTQSGEVKLAYKEPEAIDAATGDDGYSVFRPLDGGTVRLALTFNTPMDEAFA